MCFTLVGYKKNRFFGNCFARRILIDRCIRVDTQIGHDWTINFLNKKCKHDSYILIRIVKNPFSEHILSNIFLLPTGSVDCFLHGFGPSAAFRFQGRMCVGLSSLTNIALTLQNGYNFIPREFQLWGEF